jgi:hypothetical protein
MKGGGTRYGRSCGAGSVENAGFARSKRGSNKMSGTRSNLPYALGVSMEQIRNGSPQERQEKCANVPLQPPIPERDDPEQPRGKESRPGTQRLSLRDDDVLYAHSSHQPPLSPPRRPLTGPTPPKLDRRMMRRTPIPTASEDEEEGVEWGKRMYGVRMSPAHPGYVGRGDDTCGGEVVYTISEMRTLLHSQPEDTTLWLTTSQMGWALTSEENEIINERDEREGRPVARRLAPMISTFIRTQWESGELEDVDDERRQILEEAAELDHIWVVWEGEKELTNDPRKRIRQPSQSGNDIRHNVEVHASH